MTELPSGAVTFLFSDIEGSTRLVKALRERYAQVLADHRRLVRAAIARQAGHEIDTQGDAFFVAGPDGHSHRPGHPGRGSLYRPGRSPRGPDLPTAAGVTAHCGHELAADTGPGVLAQQIQTSMHNGSSQTITLGGTGGTIVLNGATLAFAVTPPNSLGGPTPHG